MTRVLKTVAYAFLLGGIVTCGGGGDNGTGPGPGPTPPDPGFLRVNLTTPNANDGAILFTLSGGVVDSLQASGFTLFSTGAGTSNARMIVAGTISGGTVASFWVPDRNNLTSYTAGLLQAAARGTYEQQALGSYGLAIAR